MEVSLVHFGKSFQWHCSWNLEHVNVFFLKIYILWFPYILSCILYTCTFDLIFSCCTHWKLTTYTFLWFCQFIFFNLKITISSPWIDYFHPTILLSIYIFKTLGSSGRKISAKLTVNLKTGDTYIFKSGCW